jgi:hypothetical protein
VNAYAPEQTQEGVTVLVIGDCCKAVPSSPPAGFDLSMAKGDYEKRIVPKARRKYEHDFAEEHRGLLLLKLGGPIGIWLDNATDSKRPVYVVPVNDGQLGELRRVLQSPNLKLHEVPFDPASPPAGLAFAVETDKPNEHYLLIPQGALDALQPIVDRVARELTYVFPTPARSSRGR